MKLDEHRPAMTSKERRLFVPGNGCRSVGPDEEGEFRYAPGRRYACLESRALAGRCPATASSQVTMKLREDFDQ